MGGKKTMKIQGPIEVKIEVGVTNGDGTEGFATYSICKGSYPTEQQMREAVEKVAEQVKDSGLRLMTKREWFDHIIPPSVEEDEDGERIRVPFAIPGGKDWDA